MTKILFAYDSKYRSSKRAAEGMKDIEGIEISVVNVKETDVKTAEGYDMLVLGAPNHMTSPSRTMTKFIESMAKLDLKAKNAAVFGTYYGRLREPDRAVRKMEKKLKKKMPKINLIPPSLSVRVHGVTGPIFEEELDRCREFGKRITRQVKEE